MSNTKTPMKKAVDALVADTIKRASNRGALLSGWRQVLVDNDIPPPCIEFVMRRLSEILAASGIVDGHRKTSTREAGELQLFYEEQISLWSGQVMGLLIDLWNASQPRT